MKTRKLSIKELLQSADCGKEVEVDGWVRTKRGNKQVNFIALNDGSTINNIQVVVDMANFPEEVMKRVTTGAALHVKGDLVESTGTGQAREIQARELTVWGEADPERYPIQPKKHSLEFLRGDHTDHIGIFTPSQAVALFLMLPAAALLYWYTGWRYRNAAGK